MTYTTLPPKRGITISQSNSTKIEVLKLLVSRRTMSQFLTCVPGLGPIDKTRVGYHIVFLLSDGISLSEYKLTDGAKINLVVKREARYVCYSSVKY